MMTRTFPTPPAKARSLAQHKADVKTEGATPGKASAPPALTLVKNAKPGTSSPFTGPLGHKQPPWAKKR